MRALVTGAGGSLGSALRSCAPHGNQVTALSRSQFDLREAGAAEHHLARLSPSVVLNAAAYTSVDGAEDHPEEAFAVNALGAESLARACKEAGALLIHISTDYVFDGTKGEPYVESDMPRPLNAYGESKREGEQRILASGCAHLIVRTSWLYSERARQGFACKVLGWAGEKKRLELVSEHLGSPTYAPHLARALWLLAARKATGLLHWAAAGRASRYEFGSFLIEKALEEGAALKAKEIDAVPAARFALHAPRPPDTSLASNRLAAEFPDALPRFWKDMAADFVRAYLKEVA